MVTRDVASCFAVAIFKAICSGKFAATFTYGPRYLSTQDVQMLRVQSKTGFTDHFAIGIMPRGEVISIDRSVFQCISTSLLFRLNGSANSELPVRDQNP